MKLFLHIGMHKTGSTSLQKCLVNENSLNGCGWNYISMNRAGNSSVFIDINDRAGKVSATFNEKLVQAISETKFENNILSGEHFFAIDDFVEVDRLYKVLTRKFSEIFIVIYLRRQDKIAVSFKQQGTKGNIRGEFLSSLLFGHSEKCIPECTDRVIDYLNYKRKIEIWSEVFGKDKLIVSDFDDLYENDICSDFSYKLKLPIQLKSVRVNEGVSRLSSLILHDYLNKGVSEKYVRKVRHALSGADSDKVLPSKKEALDFYNVFSKANIALNEYGVCFKEDFSNYKEESTYAFKETDAKVIVDAFSSISLDKNITDKEIDTLRDVAILLERDNLELAYNVMNIVKKLRPGGPFINRKVIEYSNKLKG